MSTKIYTAWRFPVKRLNEFLDEARVWWFSVAARRVRESLNSIPRKRANGPGFTKIGRRFNMPELARRIKCVLEDC